MVPPVTTRQYFRIPGQKIDKLLGLFPLKKVKSIHPVEVVLNRSDLVLPMPMHEDLVRVIVTTPEAVCQSDMMLEKCKEKMMLMKKIKDEGLVHMGDRMGELSWITLGEKEEQMARTDCREEGFEYVPEGVGRRT